MGFSQNWEQLYSQNEHQSIWPWTDLIVYFMRYAKPFSNKTKVLELGCGAGANIPLFNHLGIDYYAVDGSETAISRLKNQYPQLKNKLSIADFTKTFHFEDQFDIIFDRASLTSNKRSDIEKSIALVKNSLKIGGKYIGIHWYSEHNDYAQLGDPIEDDPITRTNFTEGPYANIGPVRFTKQSELLDIFNGFKIHKIEDVRTRDVHPEEGLQYAYWNFICEKL